MTTTMLSVHNLIFSRSDQCNGLSEILLRLTATCLFSVSSTNTKQGKQHLAAMLISNGKHPGYLSCAESGFFISEQALLLFAAALLQKDNFISNLYVYVIRLFQYAYHFFFPYVMPKFCTS